MYEFTAEDNESLDQAGRILRERGWKKAFTLDEMMTAWEQLVAQVELGYSDMVDEYTNDLACRDWLAAVWPLIAEHVRTVRAPELNALDLRFLAATTEDTAEELGRFYSTDAKDAWWWRRLPLRRFGGFAADLKSL
ncbi:hypothetical protein [Arthrobacter sp. NQ4]|uniref:hypothetical protein n=1 Tax=Arthrobacter sp. NQ4 TaxID=3027930 RepID=UPI0023B02B5A|nr:hypothetical protein [Arthrobacter sp. NQ4]MDE8589176.1 hypothetical protein [Arthrobacter sp. NQ4]